MSTRAEREAQARKLRDEGMLLREIAAEMGVGIATVSAWLCDPGGEKLKARKDGYRGTCDECGAPTDGSNGAGRAPTRCIECITWSPEAVIEVLRAWADENGGPPRQLDTVRGGAGHGKMPHYHVMVRRFGSWNAALKAAGLEPNMDKDPATVTVMADAIRRGESVKSIAARYRCTPQNVYQRLRNAGTPAAQIQRAA